MPLLVTMTFQHVNTSLQRGDFAYYVPTSSIGNMNSVKIFETGTYSNILQFGEVLDIRRNLGEVDIIWNDVDLNLDGNPDIPLPSISDFILFSKNKQANTSSLVGYYAGVGFINDSNERVELFSVGSEFAYSSK